MISCCNRICVQATRNAASNLLARNVVPRRRLSCYTTVPRATTPSLLTTNARRIGISSNTTATSKQLQKRMSSGGGDFRGAGTGRGPITWTSLGLCGVVAGGCVIYYNMLKEEKMRPKVSKVTTTGKALVGGPWTLVDMEGNPKTDKDYLGQYLLFYFGFAACPDICPAELVKVGAIMDAASKKLGRPVPVKPIFVSVDPERDSIKQLKHYGKDFHPDIEYLTGTKDQVSKIAKAYRVYYNKADDHGDSEDYLVDHSIVLYFVDKDGEFVDFYTQRATVQDIVPRMIQALKERGDA